MYTEILAWRFSCELKMNEKRSVEDSSVNWSWDSIGDDYNLGGEKSSAESESHKCSPFNIYDI